MGRKPIEIDQKNFETLCYLQCTLEEMSDGLGCSEDTIERWCKRTYGESFADTYKKKRGNGKISLRRAQFRLAEKSAAMAIWLGKQYLGQKENPDESIDEEDSDAYFEKAGILNE